MDYRKQLCIYEPSPSGQYESHYYQPGLVMLWIKSSAQEKILPFLNFITLLLSQETSLTLLRRNNIIFLEISLIEGPSNLPRLSTFKEQLLPTSFQLPCSSPLPFIICFKDTSYTCTINGPYSVGKLNENILMVLTTAMRPQTCSTFSF